MHDPYQHISDAALLERFQEQQDKKAFGVLFKRYFPLLLGTCRKYLNQPQDAEDMVMDLFEKSMEVLAAYDSIRNIRPFLYVMAKNACLGKLRKKQIKLEYDALNNQLSEEQNTDELLLKEARLTELEAAIQQLSPMQRQCIELFYFKKMRYQQVATALKLEVKTVKSHLQNGKQQLKKQLLKMESNEVR